MKKKKTIGYLIIGIIIIIIDQLTKNALISKNIVVIPNFINFTYTENKGAAFSIGTTNTVTILSLILMTGLIVYILKEYKNIKNFLPYVLIISGGTGNMIDRFFRGYVIDFIDVSIFDFPNFNFADICIFAGIMSLIFLIFLKRILHFLNKNDINNV